MALVARMCGGQQVGLLVLRDGPDFSRLVALTESLDIQNRVIFAVQVDYEEVPKYLSIADIDVAFVTQERGMWKCLPVICRSWPCDTIGTRTFITDGYNGINAKKIQR